MRLGEPHTARSSARLAARLALVGALVAVLAVMVAACGAAGSGSEVGATPGKMAPPFSGVTIDGSIVTSDEYRGRPFFLVYLTSG